MNSPGRKRHTNWPLLVVYALQLLMAVGLMLFVFLLSPAKAEAVDHTCQNGETPVPVRQKLGNRRGPDTWDPVPVSPCWILRSGFE